MGTLCDMLLIESKQLIWSQCNCRYVPKILEWEFRYLSCLIRGFRRFMFVALMIT
jgi:hypothetical protein